MSLWVAASLCAALAQALRFMLQKKISLGGISATGATYARFLFSAPIVLAGLALWFGVSGDAVPALSAGFWAFAATGALAQIVATVCVVLIFGARHFAVGVTFAKTEVIFTAALGVVLLQDSVSLPALGAIALGVAGLVVLSFRPGMASSLAALRNRAAALGLVSGVLFAVSAVCYRGASLEIDAAPVLRAALTLGAVTGLQMVGLALWLRWRAPGEGRAVLAAWRAALPLGMASLAGSFGWFLAFTLQNAAYVKAVGQVELIFALAIGALVFGERISRRDLAGMGLLSASVVALLLVA
jgi:drug/metabolite transporter (DMT)-like permease